ncbi:hypothetical protein [Staphylococcus hominis]
MSEVVGDSVELVEGKNGEGGEEVDVRLELKVVGDVGVVGLRSVGK